MKPYIISHMMESSGKNTASPPGEDDFFHEPEGLGLACTRRTRITFACGYGDSATVCFLFSLYVSMRLQLFYEAFSKRNVTFAKEIKRYLKA